MPELTKILNTGVLDVGYSVHSGVNVDLLLQVAHCLAVYRYLFNETILKNYAFLVYMYYTHPGYRTSIFGKNCVYYIQIFMVINASLQQLINEKQKTVFFVDL